MRTFRRRRRFEAMATRMGLVDYWRRFGAPDHCDLRVKLICSAHVPPNG